jgi:hypothetical protein
MTDTPKPTTKRPKPQLRATALIGLVKLEAPFAASGTLVGLQAENFRLWGAALGLYLALALFLKALRESWKVALLLPLVPLATVLMLMLCLQLLHPGWHVWLWLPGAFLVVAPAALVVELFPPVRNWTRRQVEAARRKL